MGTRGPIAKRAAEALKIKRGLPPAPASLDKIGAAEYARVGELLSGVITEGDMAIVAIYASAWADVQRIEGQVRGKEVVRGPQGPIVNPLLKALGIKKREMQSALSKLGFSPVDRARVPKAASTEEDPFAGLVK
jgi:P27 family predicted phage terminase small subunit